jgi:alkylation response protein AidB-like acyl-CoA dehydrogenase
MDDYKITEDRDMPEEVWNFLKKKGFFSMIIPKQYGGKGFQQIVLFSILNI